jgi:hypothetical protein
MLYKKNNMFISQTIAKLPLIFLIQVLLTTVASEQIFAIMCPGHSTLGCFYTAIKHLHEKWGEGGTTNHTAVFKMPNGQ